MKYVSYISPNKQQTYIIISHILQYLKFSELMQVEKHLFRIAQKSHKGEKAQLCWKAIFISTLIIGLASLFLFIIGELFVKNSVHTLRNCLMQNDFILEQDQIGLVYQNNLESINKVINTSTPLNPKNQTNFCSIYKNLNGTQILQQPQLSFTGLYSSYKMQRNSLSQLKFDNYTIIIPERPRLKQFFYGASSLFINQIVLLADRNLLGDVINSTSIYIKGMNSRVYYSSQQQKLTILQKIYSIISVILTYAIGSIITSLYIYVTIIASPAVILLFLKLTPYGRSESFFQAFKAFPWIGMHSIILRSSTNRQVRTSYTAICWSLITYFLIMYLGYYTIVLKITEVFFNQQSEAGVSEILFGYFAIIEFAALIFMRTRPFLKFFPVINTLFIFFFMLYCKFSHYGFKAQAVFSMQALGISLFSWMVYKLQIPAQTTWQPNQQFVPSIRQPRAGLISAFNLNWINALPDQWTILMPVMSADHFNHKQMSFINQNYDQLNQYLNQH